MPKKETEEFEDAIAKLEEIVRRLEAGDLSLEDSLKAFEEGMRLTKVCNDRLESAQKKIEILIKDHKGNIIKEPFDSEEE